MDKKTIEKYWNEISTKVKQKWASFSENEWVKIKKSYQELKRELEKKCADKKEARTKKELNELKDKPEKGKNKKKGKN